MEWVVLLIATGVIAIVVGVCGILSKARWGGFLTVVGVLLGGAGLALLTFSGRKEPTHQGRPTLTPPAPPGGKLTAPKLVDPRKE